MKRLLSIILFTLACITGFSQSPGVFKYISLVNVLDSTTVAPVNARMFYNEQRKIVQCYFNNSWHDWASQFTLSNGNATTANGNSVDLGGPQTSNIDIASSNSYTFSYQSYDAGGGSGDYVQLYMDPTVGTGIVELSYNSNSGPVGASALQLNVDFAGIASNNRYYNFSGTGLRISGISNAVASASLHLPAGTTTIAPMMFTSGPLLSVKAAGRWGFLSDKLYFTITTGNAEKEVTLNDIALTANRLPLVTTNGRLTDLANGASGSLVRFNGTVPAFTTLTMPNTISANSIFIANTANTLIELTPAAGQSIRMNAANTAWEAYTPSSGGTPAGSDTQIQYNNAGAFGASANFTWTNSNSTLTIGPATRVFSIDKTFDDLYIGQLTGNYTTTGAGANIGLGYASLQNITTAEGNIGIGRLSNSGITSGNYNISIGLSAGTGSTVVDNVAIGRQALDNLTTTALGNIGIGTNSGNSTTGSKNVAIGYNVEHPSATADGQLTIQNIIYGTGNTNSAAAVSVGNIGIGQVAPSYELHVTGNTNNKNLLLIEDDGGNDALDIAEVSGAIEIKMASLAADNTINTVIVKDPSSSGTLKLKDLSVAVFNSQSGSNYPLVLTDAGKVIQMTSGSANTVTVPLNSSVAYTVGTTLYVQQTAAGLTSIVATGGVTINSTSGSLDSPGQYSLMILQKTATNTWTLFNGTAPTQVNGSFSQVGAATTTFTVAIGATQPSTAYTVNVTPTALLSSALFYVTNKTTTTFDVVYASGLTGTVTFDWLVTP